MARTFTLPGLRTQVRQRADMQSTAAQGFVTDSELNTYINQSWAELYELITTNEGQEYFMNQAGIVTGGNVDTYDLPTDFWRIKGVDMVLSASQSVTIQPFMFIERNLYKAAYAGGWTAGYDMRYRIVGGARIKFIPTPLENINVTIWYVPNPPVLGETDSVDGYAGWEEYIVVDAAIKCLQKEESDVSILMARKQELAQRIMAASPFRDAGASERVTDRSVPYVYDWI